METFHVRHYEVWIYVGNDYLGTIPHTFDLAEKAESYAQKANDDAGTRKGRQTFYVVTWDPKKGYYADEIHNQSLAVPDISGYERSTY
jgi:hypothetical protein